MDDEKVIRWVKHQKDMYKFDGNFPYDVKMYDEVLKRLEQVKILNIDDVSNSLTIKEVAAKYGEKVKCMFYDYDDKWKESERIVNSSFLKDMEQGAIKNCC